jgi:hypothetical protein
MIRADFFKCLRAFTKNKKQIAKNKRTLNTKDTKKTRALFTKFAKKNKLYFQDFCAADFAVL